MAYTFLYNVEKLSQQSPITTQTMAGLAAEKTMRRTLKHSDAKHNLISWVCIAYLAQAAVGFGVGLVIPWLRLFGVI